MYILNVHLYYMNVINATTLRNNFASALKEVNKKGHFLLVSKKGKITSALVDIDFFEDLLESVNKQYLASIKNARKEVENGDVFTLKEAFGEI